MMVIGRRSLYVVDRKARALQLFSRTKDVMNLVLYICYTIKRLKWI